MSEDKRQVGRRDFSLYMSVLDELTGKVLGTLSDISTGGFKLEATRPVPLNVNIRLRIEHTHEFSAKGYISFTAKVRWCEQDRYDPTSYNVGFQIVDMKPADSDVFLQMFNRYGSKFDNSNKNKPDYFWN